MTDWRKYLEPCYRPRYMLSTSVVFAVLVFTWYGIRPSGRPLATVPTSAQSTRARCSGVNGANNAMASTLWALGQPVPWPRLTEQKRKELTMVRESERFTAEEREIMGHMCGTPVFLRRKQPVVILASVPGSGNFWTRYLIEQLTGVFTGSIYTEPVKKTRMGGGNWRNASVAAVKAHSLILGIDIVYDGVILLLRDPFDSVKAEFSRDATGDHRKEATVDMFSSKAEMFAAKVDMLGSRFEKLVTFWMGVSQGRPVHVMFFEDLKVKLKEELLKLAAFLNVEVSDQRLQCVLQNSRGVNKRQHSEVYSAHNPYNREQTIKLNRYISAGARILPRIASYVRPVPKRDTDVKRADSALFADD